MRVIHSTFFYMLVSFQVGSRRYTSLEKKYILFLCKLVCGTIIRITSLKRNFHDNLGTGGWLAVLNISVFFHKYFAAGTFHAITNHFYFSFFPFQFSYFSQDLFFVSIICSWCNFFLCHWFAVHFLKFNL